MKKVAGYLDASSGLGKLSCEKVNHLMNALYRTESIDSMVPEAGAIDCYDQLADVI